MAVKTLRKALSMAKKHTNVETSSTLKESLKHEVAAASKKFTSSCRKDLKEAAGQLLSNASGAVIDSLFDRFGSA